MSFLSVHDLCFRYGEKPVLKNFSLDVEEGEFVSLLGPSGCGKTTALMLIAGFESLSRGKIRVDGRDIVGQPPERRNFGIVFQGYALFPHMSVGENVAITPQLLGWQHAETTARVSELLDLVELPQSYARRLPSELSGGEQQRVAVARAIAARPKIVLMDEPFGALDPITRDSVRSSYQSLHGRLGLTTIMVTHDVQEAVLLADRIAVMSAGHVLAYDTPRALLSNGAAAEVTNLMAMPKRQAERIRALTEGEPQEKQEKKAHGDGAHG